MSNNPEEYFEVSESEIDYVIDNLAPEIKKENPSLIEMFRDNIRSLLKESKDPSRRLSKSILDKYGFDKIYGHVNFDDSENAKRDQRVNIMNHCFEIAKSHLEMIALDQNMSSIDVRRYTSDSSKSEVYNPSEVAVNCLESIDRFYKEIGEVDPAPDLRKDISAKYKINTEGFIQSPNTKDGKYDRDIYSVSHALDTAKLTLTIISEKSGELSSRDVQRYTSTGSLISTPSETATASIDLIKTILNSTEVVAVF